MSAQIISRRLERNLDLVWALDISASMGHYWERIKASIAKLYEGMSCLDQRARMRFGFIGFKDLNAEGPSALVCRPVFWENAEEIRSEIDGICAGLGDPLHETPKSSAYEAIYSAAVRFPWRPIESSKRTVMVITDAPPSFPFCKDILEDRDRNAPFEDSNFCIDALRSLLMEYRIWSFIYSPECQEWEAMCERATGCVHTAFDDSHFDEFAIVGNWFGLPKS